MAEYIIHGRGCQFTGIPLPTLIEYAPGTQTHLLAWYSLDEEDTLLVHLWLRLLSRIKAIDRTIIYPLGNHRHAALFDYRGGTMSHMDTLECYLRLILPNQYLLQHPYRLALHTEGEAMLQQAIDDQRFLADMATTHPHLRDAAAEAAAINELYTDTCADVVAATAGRHRETAAARDGQRRLADNQHDDQHDDRHL